MSKPVVKYERRLSPVSVGWPAVVRISSPHHTLTQAELELYDNVVTTSTVVAVNGDCFETQNTIYRQAVPVVA